MKKILFGFLTIGLSISTFSGTGQVSVSNLTTPVTPQSLFQVHDNHVSGQVFQLTNTTSGYTSPSYGFAIEIDPVFKTSFKNQFENAGAGISFLTKNGGLLLDRLTISNNGNIGIGIGIPTAKLHTVATGSLTAGYFTSFGLGLTYPTLWCENTSTGAGVAGYFTSAGTDATFVLGQQATATGPLFKAFGIGGGDEEIRIDGDGTTFFYNGNHIGTITLDPAESGPTEGGQITMYNAAGGVTISIDGDYNNTGFGRISTGELEITGGADLAEPFSVIETESIQSGMVLSIDPQNPGKLKVASSAYDHCVAGICSGASNIKPGLILRQKGTAADGDQLIALSGRVYCLADATNGSINPGDLLTTSDTPGYAMKVTSYEKAHGAIIGKAMTALPSGKGMVLVLVSLQ
ncbi:MAG: hypothetical protein WCK09_03720 [Bacteroidota bacterium]